MTGNPDVSAVRGFLARVQRQLATIAIVEGAAIGVALAVVFVVARWSVPAGIATTAVVAALLAALGAAVSFALSSRKRARAALLVERRAPECRNLVFTANELMAGANRAPLPISPIVYRQAAQAVGRLDVRRLFPTRRAWLLLAASSAMLVLMLAVRATPALSVAQRAASTASAGIAIQRIDVTVAPPSYVKRNAQTQRDPSRIEALAGSHVRLTINASAASVTVETLLGAQSLARAANGTFIADVVADADGFIALEPVASNGTKGARRLIGLTVLPDRAPRVRLTAPAKDMMLPDGNRAIDLAVEADDDIALSTLRLRYTQVSGSGERYTFKEGEVPLQLSRTSAAGWTAKARWNLAALGLEAGDMVVYRAVATDARSGAPASESDSYIAEILMAGSDAAAGFSIDPEQERYALSQQMIIVKTERLSAKRATVTAEAFADEANDIAVEQRRVRAEFVFMMGGELADEPLPDEDMTTLHEEAEAEGESDILAGRGANAGRIALVAAIRNMSSAATLLNTASVTEALVRERAALKQLERAFSHTRIILRALTQQERLDLTRRMTGPLLEAGRDQHPSANPENNPRVVALRGVLAGIAELTSAANSASERSSERSSRAVEFAERVLRAGPSEKPLQEIAAHLNQAALALGKSQNDVASRELGNAAVKLTAAIKSDVVTAPARTRTLSADRLDGALADLLRLPRGSK